MVSASHKTMSGRDEVDSMSNEQSPDESVMSNWDQVVTSMENIEEEYRDEGWSTLLIHPGNVEPLGDKEVEAEFDVLVPDNEYEELQDWMDEGGEPTEFEIYKNAEDGVMYAVVVATDPQTSLALILPLHYDHTERSSLMASAQEAGTVRIDLRPLSGGGITLTFDSDTFFEMPEE